MARDEMVDGKGGLRPQWRNLLGVLAGLGHGVLAERGKRLDRMIEEEGVASLLPGAPPDPWHFDPIPLPLSQAEFSGLEAGLAQRARLLDALLGDLYGPQAMVAEGVLPAALVYGNPTFLRPCREPDSESRGGRLLFYAADLIRAADGAWHVLADRTGLADGLAHALQNRRRLGRVLPELFASQLLCHIEPFVELCLDLLQNVGANGGLEPGRPALLSPGHGDPAWYEHVLLARELACTLVEGGDLTVRDGSLFLKTLRGLQPVGALLRGIAGRSVDPLELEPDGLGVPGLLAAARDHVRIVNDPGSALVKSPGLAPFLPGLARRLLDADLLLPSVPTLWLGRSGALASVVQRPTEWYVHSAFDPKAAPTALSTTSTTSKMEQKKLLDRIAAAPWRHVATPHLAPSVAPCLGEESLMPRPVLVRMFLVRDRDEWRAMPGGLGCVLPEGEQCWPNTGPLLAKDVWILAENPEAVLGLRQYRATPLAIRRICRQHAQPRCR